MHGAGIDLEVEIYATKRYVFSSNYLESGRWTKSENPVILCVMHRRQNPMESTCHQVRRPSLHQMSYPGSQ
jgi:hypothetical protein